MEVVIVVTVPQPRRELRADGIKISNIPISRFIPEAALLVEHDSPVIRAWLEEAHARLRRQLAATFAPELAREGRDLLAALEVSASWTAWESLRRRQGLSVSAARRVLARMLTALLEEQT